jgi:hypothetical protein
MSGLSDSREEYLLVLQAQTETARPSTACFSAYRSRCCGT